MHLLHTVRPQVVARRTVGVYEVLVVSILEQTLLRYRDTEINEMRNIIDHHDICQVQIGDTR